MAIGDDAKFDKLRRCAIREFMNPGQEWTPRDSSFKIPFFGQDHYLFDTVKYY
jgi:hypothetical protein